MKRLVLALASAATVLGTGCGSSAHPSAGGALDMAWRFIRVKPDGSTVAYGCAFTNGTNVDSVAVSFPSGSQTVPCADNAGDGGLFVGLPPGTQQVVVTGRRAGVDVYSSSFNLNVVSGATTPVDLDVYGIPDDLDVLAELVNPTGSGAYTSCNAAGVTSYTYRIIDSAGTEMASGTASCSTDLPGIAFHGNQALDRDTYTIRMQAPATGPVIFDTATTAVAPACSGQPFGHTGPDTGANAWAPLMYDTTANATVCQ